MPQTISRDRVLAFYHAYSQRDLSAVETFLHEDVRWTVNGPVDVLAYCGERRNRGDVMRMLREVVPQIFRHRQFDLARGAELAKQETGRDDYLDKQAQAQISVPEAELVEAVRGLLARTGGVA